MAEIQITREQAATTGGWPRVCIRCGGPAEVMVEAPQRFCRRDVARLEAPFCSRHVAHWHDYRRSSFLGTLLSIAAIVGAFVAAWFILDPFGPAQRWQDDRIVAFFVLPWFAGVVVALPFAIRLGSPVHVRAASTHWITLAGVSEAFVSAWNAGVAAAGLPSAHTLKAAERFEVTRYRPDGVCPWPGTLYVLVTTLLAGSVAGWCAGRGALALAASPWPANDIDYLVLIGALGWAWSLLFLAFIFFPVSLTAIPFLLRPALAAVPVAILVAGAAWVLAWLPLRQGRVLVTLPDFAMACVSIPPLFLVVVIVLDQAREQKLRSWFVAGAAGMLGPLWATAIGCLYTWNTPAFQQILPIGGGGLALAGSIACFNQARWPFCGSCQNWMTREFLGALSRPAGLIAELVQNGEIVRLAAETLHETADAGDVELATYTCPICKDQGPIVLDAVAVISNGKNTTRKKLGFWLYPSTAFPALRKLFPKWRADQENA